jgi:hypothetical protein
MATMQRGIGSPINTARYGGGGGLGVNMSSGGGGGGGGPTPAAAMMNARRRDPRWNLMGSKAYNDNQYKLTGHGKTVTEAINEGGNVQAWAPSTGVGPGTRGYRGSYENPYFKTGRPSASNSGEYYANRDAVLGNPLTMLQLNGPGRYNLMDSIIAETRGTRQGTDAYYADKAISDGSEAPVESAPPSGAESSPMEFYDQNHETFNTGAGQRGFMSKYDANSGYLRGGAQGSVDPIAIARAAALKEAGDFRAVSGGSAEGSGFRAVERPEGSDFEAVKQGEGAGFEAAQKTSSTKRPSLKLTPLQKALWGADRGLANAKRSLIRPFTVGRDALRSGLNWLSTPTSYSP